MKYEKNVHVVGLMPPFHSIAEHIWGQQPNINSDGDSSPAESVIWRELTMSLRPDHAEQIDIYPVSDTDRDFITVKATNEELLRKTIAFLLSKKSIAL